MSINDEKDFYTERPLASTASGCMYSFYVVALSAGLLFINALLCLTIYAAMPKHRDEQIASRIGQMYFFVVPVILLIVEWNLLDRLQRLFRRNSS